MKSVLFYSFKGGVGRTQAMLNIAKYLAREQDKKILIVDFDIYAPGLSYLAKFNKQENNNGSYVVDFLLESFKGNKVNLYTEKVEDNLYLTPAYDINIMKQAHSSLSELSQYLYTLKIGAEKRKDHTSTIADTLYKYITETVKRDVIKFDYIFFDARTGITEVSDILFSNFLDLKVIISSFNKQNIKGTKSILNILAQQKGLKHKILRLLSPEPLDYKRELFKDIEQEADLKDNSRDEILRKEFDWMGVSKISYDKEVVINDFYAWGNVGKKYEKEIINISNLLNDKLSDNDKLKDILQ